MLTIVTVLAHGTFDLLHLGHVRFLEQAKKLGDRLIVIVTADDYVRKGPGRPVFTAAERCEILSALRCVDGTCIVYDETALPAIKEYHPQLYAKGSDYIASDNANLHREREAVEAVGGKLVIVTSGQKWSSTELLAHAAAH